MATFDHIPPASQIESTLRRVRARLLRAGLIAVGERLLAAAALAVVLLTGLDSLFWLPGVWRLGLLTALAAILAGILQWGLWRAWQVYGRLEAVARACDHAAPELHNGLESALQFMGGAFRSGEFYSTELVAAALERTASNVRGSEAQKRLFDNITAPRAAQVRRRRRILLAACSLCLGLFLYRPLAVGQSLRAWADPFDLIRRERAYHLIVSPGNITLMRGDSLSVRAVGSIHRPGRVRLDWWQAGKVGQSREMSYLRDQFEYRADLGPLESDLSYVVSQGSTVTDTFRVTVTSNPFVTSLHLRYEYPAYTGLGVYETERDRAVQALRGTRVVLSGRASNPLAAAELRLERGEVHRMPVTAERVFCDTLVLDADTRYSLRLTDTWGLANTDTLPYPVTVLNDEAPRIVLLFPEAEANLGREMVQPLMYEAADDYGLSRVSLSYRKEKTGGRREDQERSLSLPAGSSSGATHVLERFNWELGELHLLPGESVLYRLTAWDNDRVSGPKATASAEFRLKFPSLEEIFKQGEKQQEQIASRLDDLGQEGQKTLEQVKKMQEALERGHEMDWQEKQRLGQALERQKQISEQVGRLADQMKQNIERMQSAGASSPELLEKLQRVQQLMDEISTDEVKELLSKIQSSLDKLDNKALSDQMNKLEFSQEKLLDKLDKTISVLEKVKLEQQMDFLVSRTRELAAASEALADSVAVKSPDGEQKGESADSLAASGAKPGQPGSEASADSLGAPGSALSDSTQAGGQSSKRETEQSPLERELTGKEPAEALDQMKKLTAEVFDRMGNAVKSFDRAGQKELAAKLGQESAPEQRESFEQDYEETEQALEAEQPGKAAGSQRRAGRRMDALHERMEKYSRELKEKWRQEVSEAILRAFDNLDYLSRHQEEVAEQIQAETDFSHPDVLKIAGQQQEVSRGLSTVLAGLVESARDNFFISVRLLDIVDAASARSESAASLLSAEERNKDQAFQAAAGALAAINAGMLSLMEDHDNLLQSSSGVGMDRMMKQLEQLSRRQEELNRNMQQQMGSSQRRRNGQNPSGTGSGLSLPPQSAQGQMQEMLRQMAAEQRAIQEQLARMAEQAGQSAQTGRLKDALEGMEKEASEVAEQMLKRGVTPETLQRQQRLLDRMLSAQHSLRNNDSRDNERKSETARDYTPAPPSALSPDLLDPAARQSELEAIFQKWNGAYPESYENLIRKYYERLNAPQAGPEKGRADGNE
ncbi:hypothetical protein LLH00_09895 [bacterium]|nr:hypothetical protein [bacterium]